MNTTATGGWVEYDGPDGCHTALRAVALTAAERRAQGLRIPDPIPAATRRRDRADGTWELVCTPCEEGQPCTT